MKKVLIASVLSFGLALSVQAKDVVRTAVATGSFKTLATAPRAVGLVDALKDTAKLTAVLTYHVEAGKVMAADGTTGNGLIHYIDTVVMST